MDTESLILLGQYSRAFGLGQTNKLEAVHELAELEVFTADKNVFNFTEKQEQILKQIKTLVFPKEEQLKLLSLLHQLDDAHLIHHGIVESWNHAIDLFLSLDLDEDELEEFRPVWKEALSSPPQGHKLGLHFDVVKLMGEAGLTYDIAEYAFQFSGRLITNPLGCYLNLANSPADTTTGRCVLEAQGENSPLRRKVLALQSKLGIKVLTRAPQRRLNRPPRVLRHVCV